MAESWLEGINRLSFLQFANLHFAPDSLPFFAGKARLFRKLPAKAVQVGFSRGRSYSFPTIKPVFSTAISPDAPQGVHVEVNAMKRLISAALALTLFGTSAAVAEPWGRHGGRGGHGYGHGRHHGDNGAGLAIGLGIGLFALAAIAASQNNDRYDDRYDRRAYGYDNGYGNRYGGYRGGYNDYRYGYRGY